ncbi:hypothetical protein BDN72DRAFT_884176 [Pluteus cervinus]|uniref:Uncharacterized protein n=1 Tax=Pluteus cervinus TaxID=181527 RepID=A0ACD2ZZZ6_9AGAR|nr:hypothetical protein BDN72DRAFT_884176 [Pluteus cervinus]
MATSPKLPTIFMTWSSTSSTPITRTICALLSRLRSTTRPSNSLPRSSRILTTQVAQGIYLCFIQTVPEFPPTVFTKLFRVPSWKCHSRLPITSPRPTNATNLIDICIPSISWHSTFNRGAARGSLPLSGSFPTRPLQ